MQKYSCNLCDHGAWLTPDESSPFLYHIACALQNTLTDPIQLRLPDSNNLATQNAWLNSEKLGAPAEHEMTHEATTHEARKEGKAYCSALREAQDELQGCCCQEPGRELEHQGGLQLVVEHIDHKLARLVRKPWHVLRHLRNRLKGLTSRLLHG